MTEVSDGRQIGIHLEELLKRSTPYVRSEVSAECRFDMIAFIEGGVEFPAKESEIKHQCYFKFEKKYCDIKKRKKIGKYEIDYKEEQKYYEENNCWCGYKYDERYMKFEELWAILKIYCECEGKKCKEWLKNEKIKYRDRKEYGFLTGLHIFEIKSDKDNFLLLNHQLPQMVKIADYCWLVIGENQEPPEWLPPYICILRHIEKGNKFEIVRHNKFNLNQPQLYRHVISDHGYPMLKSSETPSIQLFSKLIRKWQINGMFRWDNDGEILLDMSKELKTLIKYLRKIDTNPLSNVNDKLAMKFQTELFEFEKSKSERGD